MTRNKIIKKLVVTLAAAAVLFAITSNVAEAAKINPNPMGKPGGGGTVFGKAEPGECFFNSQLCESNIQVNCAKHDAGGARAGRDCRKGAKARCDRIYRNCKKTEIKEKKTLPSTTGTIMKTVPMKQFKMAPTKQK